MKRFIRTAMVACPGLLLWGCGSSLPAPTQPMADVEAAHRSAQELGAAGIPEANLHLQLAEEQRKQAAQLVKDGDNERATALLVRAKADAELAVALAHEQRAKVDVQKTTAMVQAKKNSTPGAAQ